MNYFKRGELNVVYGKPGSGKTTFAIQNLPKSIVLDTEGGVSEERLSQLGLTPKVITVHSWQQQSEEIDKLNGEPVIIDRLTHLYKFEVCKRDEQKRTNSELSNQIIKLKKYAKQFNVPVVLTNVMYENGSKPIMLCNDILRVNSKVIIRLENYQMFVEKHLDKSISKQENYEIEKEGIILCSRK